MSTVDPAEVERLTDLGARFVLGWLMAATQRAGGASGDDLRDALDAAAEYPGFVREEA